jgi:short subunit dehydrogenase-like uncharacterized protein
VSLRAADVLVYGATGFTGRLVVQALLDLGVTDVRLGGRDEEKLRALSDRHGGLPFGVADATQPETLRPLVRGAHVVVATAGPFLRFGEPVVRASLEAGAHFLDTTGEQAFMRRILDLYDAQAKARRLVVVNAQAFEFAIGYCAGAWLAEAEPSIHTIDVFNRVAGFGTSQGTQKSALLAMTSEALVREGCELVPRGLSPLPKRVRFPGSDRTELAVPFPGGEALHLHHAYPELKNVTTNLVLPRVVAGAVMAGFTLKPALELLARAGALDPLGRAIERGPEGPSVEAREKQRFRVLARGRGPSGEKSVLVTGVDPYGITGVIAALGAKKLLEGAPGAVGVVSTNQAFGGKAFLDDLAPHGVSASLHG